MKILITGAAGFVGAHLINLLKNDPDNEIFAWVKDEQESSGIELDGNHIGIVDITRKEQVMNAFADICPDCIYHLAAQSSVGLSWKEPALTYEVNAVGSVHLLETVRLHNPQARVLLVGSAEQYGTIREEELPIAETQPLQGVNPYSISKMMQEQTARLYVDSYKLHIVLVRAFNHIGPGQSERFVIPDWCSQVVRMECEGRPGSIRVGNIDVRRDFTDVRDIVKAYAALMEHGQSGEVYNVGSGRAYSLKDVLDIILSCTGCMGVRYEVDEDRLRPADTPELRADISRLTSTINWTASYSLRQSVEDILEEMRRRVQTRRI